MLSTNYFRGKKKLKRISFRGLCGFLYPKVFCWQGLWEPVYLALSEALSSRLLEPNENEIKNWVNIRGRKSQEKGSQKLQHLLDDHEAILTEVDFTVWTDPNLCLNDTTFFHFHIRLMEKDIALSFCNIKRLPIE